MPGTVCVIGLYFGKLPETFSLWLKSCEWNSTIDFLVFTDQRLNKLPDNVTCVDFSLQKFKKLADEKMGLDTCLERPYKLCDFKPAYGFLFEEYIKDYEYWGICDFDLVWGDIRSFIEKYDYKKYDKFLPMGHLMLYRNTYECNRRFMLDGSCVGNYDHVFTTSNSTLFDEAGGMSEIYRKHNFSEFVDNIYADISVYNRRLMLQEKMGFITRGVYEKYFREKGSNAKYQLFCWSKGKVLRLYYEDSHLKSEEFIYIHLQKRAMIMEASVNDDTVFITPGRFVSGNIETITIEDIKKLNPYKGRLYEWCESYFIAIRNIIKNILKKKNKVAHIPKKQKDF